MIGEIPWAFLPGEYHAHLIGGNAAAVVPDNETHPLGGCFFQLEDDVPARFREFHGVGHQVEQRLTQCLGIKAAQNILGRQNQLQISIGCLYQRRQQLGLRLKPKAEMIPLGDNPHSVGIGTEPQMGSRTEYGIDPLKQLGRDGLKVGILLHRKLPQHSGAAASHR